MFYVYITCNVQICRKSQKVIGLQQVWHGMDQNQNVINNAQCSKQGCHQTHGGNIVKS